MAHLKDAKREKEIRDKFMEYDTDGNGSVSYEEAHGVLEKELGFSKERSKKLVHLCDTNNDGSLSYEEFVEFYVRVRSKMTDLKKHFEKFDKNGDGEISLEEAKDALRLQEFTDVEIECLVASYDLNNDGHLQYEEFVRFWNDS